MSKAVLKRFEKWYKDAQMHYNAIARWEIIEASKSSKFSAKQTSFFNSTLSTLSQYYGEDTSCFKICEQAILRRGYGSKSANVHERLNLGDIVQILVNDGNERASILDASGSENGMPSYFVIGAFIQSQSDHSWIAVKKCKLLSRGKMHQVPDFNSKPVLPVLTTNMFDRHHQHQLQFIKLSKSVRKVGFQHDCSVGNRCVRSSSSRRITHAASTLDGSRFFYSLVHWATHRAGREDDRQQLDFVVLH